MKGDLKIGKYTGIHCKTEELAKKVLSIAEKLGYKWSNGAAYSKINNWVDYKEKTYYCLSHGSYGTINCIEKEYIIEAEDFLKLHEPNKRVYIKGSIYRHKEVIATLEALGGKNLTICGDCETGYYYINKRGDISCCDINSNEAFLLEQAFKEYTLPDKRETIIIGCNTYYKDEFEKAVKDLKPVKQ